MKMLRHPHAAMGEITIDDDTLEYYRIKHVIVCKGRHTYIADALEPSRNIDGKLIFHYLEIDPLENADSIVFEIGNGAFYTGGAGK